MHQREERGKYKSAIPPKGYLSCRESYEATVALQALSEGTATPDQQKRVIEWIQDASMVNALNYDSESDRNTAFMCGRQYVGTLLRLELSKIPVKYYNL